MDVIDYVNLKRLGVEYLGKYDNDFDMNELLMNVNSNVLPDYFEVDVKISEEYFKIESYNF